MRGTTLQLTLMLLAAGVAPAVAQESQGAVQDTTMEARIWLDRGDDPVLHRGDGVRIYYRVNADAYVAIFHIDTDGSLTLLYPRSPGEDDFTRADRDYRLLFPSSSFWYVDEYPGKGYFFLVASSQPLDFDDYGYSSYDHAWNLSEVGQSVYTDPYVAMDDHVTHLIPDWQSIPYALDFTSYDVGSAYAYPRFMCYQCHGYRSFTSWDPYAYGCSAVRVVIWNDPYYSHGYGYRGTRVVLARSHYGIPRYRFKKRMPGDSWLPIVRTPQPYSRKAHYVGPGSAGSSRTAVPGRRAVPREVPVRSMPRTVTQPSGQGRRAVPRTGGAAGRAPAARLRTNPSVAPPNAVPERPILRRRPTSVLRRPARWSEPRAVPATPDARRRSEAVPQVPRRPTVTTQPARARFPSPRTATPRPVVVPRSRTGGGGGRPAVRPSSSGVGGRYAVPRRAHRRHGGGGG